jgi:hypothetical protein
MELFSTTRRKIVSGVVTGAVLLGAGGTAFAASAATTGGGSGSSTATAPGATTKKHHDLALRSDHTTFEVKRKGAWVTIAQDRGKVTVVTPGSLSFQRPDGQTETVTLTASTKYDGVTSSSGLTVGRGVIVRSINGTAIRVAQRTVPATNAPGTSSTTTANG